MKKSLLALAALSAFAGVASAQTNVTIYGTADAGLVRQSGGAAGSVTKLDSGVYYGNRLGFKGTEDLGGGLSAKFQLESGFNLDNGSLAQGANVLWGRQAFVGLQGGFGSVTMGRQYTPLYVALERLDPFSAGLTGAATNLMSPGANRTSTNNALVYSAPTLGGFSADLQYGFGEVPGSTSGNRAIGLGLGYANGPVAVKLAYNNANNATATANAKTTLLGGTYDFGVAKAHLAYARNTGSGVDSNDALVGVSVPFGASKVLVSYINKNDKSAANQDANQIAIGYTYDLSKRTTLYTSYSRINNKNGATYLVGDATGTGSGDKGFAAGIAHKF
jgi:predicted porin